MVPQALRDLPQWLIWRFEKKAGQEKLAKVPYYADGGRRVGKQGSEADRRHLVTYTEAVKAAPAEGKGGIGFAFLPGDGLIGIDLDNVIDLATGEITERAINIIRACDSFTEYSPSGKGVHIYVRGASSTFKKNELGIEVFSGRQFFTVTGKHYSDTPEVVNEIDPRVIKKLELTVKGKPAAAAPAPAVPSKGDDFARVNDAAMRSLSSWVPALLPSARTYLDGYRVSQRDLGRADLQEDLSILPGGIVDWGVHDQGDARAGRRTPIDLVIEWSSNKKPADALHWLADKVGITLEKRKPRRQSGGAGDPPADDPEGGDADGGELPLIRWKQGKLPEVVDQAEAALLKSGLRIYQRAGFLVRVVRRDTPSVRHYKRRPPGGLGITTVDSPYLIESFTRAARWEKYNARAAAWQRCNAPEQAAQTYLARRGHWQLPRLWSAISAPTLRPDGTVLQEPGYDAATQCWYDPGGIEFPEIPSTPTYEDAQAALKVFAGAFDSFPFASKVDRSVALSLALTSLVRRSLPSAPMGGITAPTPGSGKTLLADCIAILSTGISAPAMKYADTDEEATKTMLAVLAEGDQVLLIDNVERPLGGDTLCAVLTSETFRQRMLGRTEMMTVPTTTLFLATGNHLVVFGDLRARALLCRIDAKVEHPEQRQFEGEKREWITQHRPELVAAGLTMMRAFTSTGQQVRDHCQTWGRFERWSDMIRAPLIWLGCEDPCVSLSDLEREDPERIELLRMLIAWENAFADEGYTAREAVDRAGSATSTDGLALALRDVCKDRDGSLNPKKLGHWLRSHSDRLVSGKHFVRAGEKDHTLLWKVESMK